MDQMAREAPVGPLVAISEDPSTSGDLKESLSEDDFLSVCDSCVSALERALSHEK